MDRRVIGRIETASLGIGTAGAWAKAIRVGDFIFLSGQVSWDAKGNILGIGDPSAQARQALKNIQGLLKQAGAELSEVVKLTVYVTDLSFRPSVYAEIVKAFGGKCPCSTGLVVKGLARPELLVEIDALAVSSTYGRKREK